MPQAWSITSAVFLTAVVVPIPSSSPPCLTKTKPNHLASKNAATMQMTPPNWYRGSTQTGYRMQLVEIITACSVLHFPYLRRQCQYRHHRVNSSQGYPKRRTERKDTKGKQPKKETKKGQGGQAALRQGEPAYRRW